VNQGRWDEAVRHFQETIKLQPDFIPARRALDDLLKKIKKNSRSVPNSRRPSPTHP